MKKLIFTVVCGAFMMLAACQDSKSNSNNNTNNGIYAQTPVVTCNLPGQTNCNPGVYQQQNWQVYPYQAGFSNGFCGCPVGTRPVMSPQYGIGCAPNDVFMTNYQYSGWGYYPSNNQWTNIPQVTYNPAVSGTNGANCFSDAAKICSVRSANSCGGTATCRPVGGGSDLGLCTNSYGQENYSHPRNCGYSRNSWGGWEYRCSANYNSYNNYNYGFGGGVGTPR